MKSTNSNYKSKELLRFGSEFWQKLENYFSSVLLSDIFIQKKIHKICIKPNAQAQIALIKLHQLWERQSVIENQDWLCGKP